ncbi:MAG: hypothetical protein FD138_4078, partial [Planctomycetota bacterium]
MSVQLWFVAQPLCRRLFQCVEDARFDERYFAAIESGADTPHSKALFATG